MSRSKRWLAAAGALALSVGVVGGAAAQSPSAETQSGSGIKLGFVTHSLGNPFIQQIQDAAQLAADEAGASIQFVGVPDNNGDQMLALAQGLVQSGVQGIITSVPQDTMVAGLNEIIAGGVPVVQFNILGNGVNAPYVGEKSVESGRILGKAILDKLGGDTATGTVVIGNCYPGVQVLTNRGQGVEESLAAATGITINGKGGSNDVKVTAAENYAAWEALLTANPDAVALIGLCAPDVASLGKLKAAYPDSTFIGGGYDLTPENLEQLANGDAYVSLGQTPFIQGYLPVKILLDTIASGTAADIAKPGFINAGTEIVTKDSVTEPFDLPALTFEQLQALASDKAAWREYYQPAVDGYIANWKDQLQDISAESE
ncbi:MAG: substrate-binding domain-containing protein [Chloroflexota bacterium]